METCLLVASLCLARGAFVFWAIDLCTGLLSEEGL